MFYAILNVNGEWWTSRGWGMKDDRRKYKDLNELPQSLPLNDDWGTRHLNRTGGAPHIFGAVYVDENRETVAAVYAER